MKTDEGLKGVARALEDVLPEIYGFRMGFALMVFPFGSEERGADYISNGDRECMIKALREAADKLEAGKTIPITIGEA